VISIRLRVDNIEWMTLFLTVFLVIRATQGFRRVAGEAALTEALRELHIPPKTCLWL
jgi:hypothetical protein